MTLWEYKRIYDDPQLNGGRNLLQALDYWGRVGWELVTVLPDDDCQSAYLKRPLEATPEETLARS